jgi:hypothetical protein
MRRLLVTTAALVGLTLNCQAATVEYMAEENGFTVFNLHGQILDGDTERFLTAVEPFKASKIIVLLESMGGRLLESLTLGQEIRKRGYYTAVGANGTCASACGFIWLAGSQRFLSISSAIGFHAGFWQTGSLKQESGVLNAILGSYLTRLGFEYDAIAYVTSEGPNALTWLHPAEARKYGIDFHVVPSAKSVTNRH